MTTRRTSKPLFTGGLLATLISLLIVAWVPAAQAAEVSVTDPARDNQQAGLDIVGATITNSDYAVAVSVSFRRDRSGFYAVALKARERGVLRVGGEYRPRTQLVREVLLGANGPVRCDGLSSTWDAEAISVTFHIPSTCLWQGNYGAIRSPWLLTESAADHDDVDVAGPVGWIPRG